MLSYYYALISIFGLFWNCDTITLPDVIPQGYRLKLHPNLENNLLNGRVWINVAIYAEPVNLITLDLDPPVDLNYSSIAVVSLPEEQENAPAVKLNVTTVERTFFKPNKLRIYLAEKLVRDVTYQVQITFSCKIAKISDNRWHTASVFTTSFAESNSMINRTFVIMDLTKTGCSSIFPCFNNPEFKTWFVLSVIRPASYYALSTAVVNYTNTIYGNSTLMEDHFTSTPPISCTALSLVVSNYPKVFQITTEPDIAGHKSTLSLTTKEVWSSSGGRSALYTMYDLHTLKHLLQNCEHRLLKYPLPVLNIIPVPTDFIPRVHIESFGLIVLNDNLLWPEELAEDEFSSYMVSILLLMVSQWFQFLTTPVTKNSIVEAIEFHISSSIARNIKSQIGSIYEDEYDYLYIYNEKWSNHNQTSYDIKKNVNVLHMLEDIFGQNTFINAYRSLLYKKQFKTYTDDDIWDAVSESALESWFVDGVDVSKGIDVKQVVYSWLNIKPIPLITVNYHQKTNELLIFQEPWIYEDTQWKLKRSIKQAENFASKWWIPITVAKYDAGNQVNEQNITWISEPNQSIDLYVGPSEFIIINPSINGPYIVNYDLRNWKMLVENFSVLPTSIKIRLLTSAKFLAEVGRLDYGILLNMTLAIETTPENLPVWDCYENLIHPVIIGMLNETGLDNYLKYLSVRLSPLYENLNMSEKHRLDENRYRWFELVRCESDFLNCQQAKIAYQSLISDSAKALDLYYISQYDGIYSFMLKKTELEEWRQIADLIFNSISNYPTTSRRRAIYTLAATEQPPAINMLLDLLLLNRSVSEFMTDDEKIYSIELISRKNVGCLTMMEFIDENFDYLKQKLSNDVWKYYLQRFAFSLWTRDDLKKLIEFYNRRRGQFGANEADVENLIDQATVHVLWMERVIPKIDDWINRFVPTRIEFLAEN